MLVIEVSDASSDQVRGTSTEKIRMVRAVLLRSLNPRKLKLDYRFPIFYRIASFFAFSNKEKRTGCPSPSHFND